MTLEPAIGEPSPPLESEELAEAAMEILESDDSLLNAVVQEAAARADEEHPLGIPGAPFAGRSPLRTGFAAAAGVLAALALAALALKAGGVLILMNHDLDH